MTSRALNAKRALLLTVLALLVLAAVLALTACGPSGKYKIDYSGQASDYKNPPASANPGDKVDVICGIDVSDAIMTFYVDDKPVSVEYGNNGDKVISFTMPDHDVMVEYRVSPDPAGAGA